MQSAAMQSRQSLPFPSSTILLDSYTGNQTAFATASPRTSDSIIADPIATHLLVETALGDSKTFEVLTPEELESLKKEDNMLVSRIDGARRKLAMETKVRDAAKSLNRLYTNHKRNSSGLSMTSPTLGRKNSGAPRKETIERSESELAESTKMCEQLSRELYYLEQRSRQTQMRLLQHTAGILQMTYGNGHRPNLDMIPGGRPYSPESLELDRGEDGSIDGTEGDRILAQGAESLDGFLDGLRGGGKSNGASKNRREAQLAIGKRLEELNSFVREIIGQVNPKNELASNLPPKTTLDAPNVDGAIFDQLNLLNRGLDELKAEQRNIQASRVSIPSTPTMHTQAAQLRSELESSIQENLALQKDYDLAEDNMTRMLEELNTRLFDVISTTSQDQGIGIPSIPTVDEGPTEQINYARARVTAITKIIQSLTEAAQRSRSASASNIDRNSQYEVVLQGLWQIILAGEEDGRQRKREERQQLAERSASGEAVDSDDDISPDEDDGLSEDFSLPAFSTKVQWLVSNATYLKEKQSSLRRRMRQLRQVAHNTRDATDSAEAQRLREEIERTNDLYATAKEELKDAESRLANATAESQAEARSVVADLQSRLGATESRAAALQTDLAESSAAVDKAESRAHKTEEELRALETEIVRLTTDLTIARADLDAAYGSRQERAAEVAKAAESDATVKLQEAVEREKLLKNELEATLAEFEELTRASVEQEREREELERVVDKLRESIETLEGRLGDEKVQKLGMGGGGEKGAPVVQTTSAGMLKTEFKKMMRDTRAEHLKALRAEQEERRKLEALVRSLKRDQTAASTPGKSNLSRPPIQASGA